MPLLYPQNPMEMVPEVYELYTQKFNERLKKVNVASTVPLEALYELDTFLTQTYYDTQLFARILDPVTTVMKRPKWQSKRYIVEGDKFPAFTQKKFSNPPFFKLGVDKDLDTGVGWYNAYEIDWQMIDEAKGSIYDIENWHARKAMESMALCENGRLAIGSLTQYKSRDDYGFTGLLNHPDTTKSIEAGIGNDNNVTAEGDIEATLDAGLTHLKQVLPAGDIIVISTGNVAQECIDQVNSTTGDSEVIDVWKKFFYTGRIQEWWICNELYEADVTALEGRIMMMKRSPMTMKREIIYPLQTIPLQNTLTAKDIKEMIIKADLFKLYDNNAILPFVNAGDYSVVCTKAGNLLNGLFLTGKGSYHPFTYPSLYTPIATG